MVKINWITLTMDEIWYYHNDSKSKVFGKPVFPTMRWGKITTKTSTTHIYAINNMLPKLKKEGFSVRKRRCPVSEAKWKKWDKFYKIEIKETDYQKFLEHIKQFQDEKN